MKTMVEEQQIAINSLINRVNKLEKQGKGRLFLLCYEIRYVDPYWLSKQIQDRRNERGHSGCRMNLIFFLHPI